MNTYLLAWNAFWGLMAVVVLFLAVTLLFLLPLLLVRVDAYLIFVILTIFIMLITMGYLCLRELLLPHLKAHSLVKKSKALLNADVATASLPGFEQSVWNAEGMVWQYQKELLPRKRHDWDRFMQESLHKRLSADDLLILTERDALRLALNPLDSKRCDDVLHALVELVQRGEWKHMSSVVPAIPAVNHASRKGYIAHYHAYRKCLLFTGNHMLNIRHTLFCLKDYRGFVETRQQGIEFAVCRTCKKSSFGISVTQVALVIDRTAAWKTRHADGVFEINYFMMDELPDFDCINIGNHTIEDIEGFCIKIGNDNDAYRMDQYDRVFYRALPGITMDPESRALIDKFVDAEDLRFRNHETAEVNG